MYNYVTYNNRFHVFISDAAKSENPGDLIVYTDLESSVNLTVKFHTNPVWNYTVYWSRGDLVLSDTKIRNTVKGVNVQTSYSISGVTSKHLGNYIVQVINRAIMGEPNKVTFNVILGLRGKMC